MGDIKNDVVGDNSYEKIQELILEKNKVYEVFGNLVISYQEVVSSLKDCLVSIFYRNGLSNKELAILLTNNIPDNKLCNLFPAIYKLHVPDDDYGFKTTDKLSRRFSAIIKTRNDIFHGDWSISSIVQNGSILDTFAVGKKMVSRKGSKSLTNKLSQNDFNDQLYEQGHYSKDYFKKIIGELGNLRAYFNFISIYIKNGLHVGKVIDGKQYVSWEDFNTQQNKYLDSLF